MQKESVLANPWEGPWQEVGGAGSLFGLFLTFRKTDDMSMTLFTTLKKPSVQDTEAYVMHSPQQNSV